MRVPTLSENGTHTHTHKVIIRPSAPSHTLNLSNAIKSDTLYASKAARIWTKSHSSHTLSYRYDPFREKSDL